MAAAAHERDFSMAELHEVAESEFGGAALVENDVRNPLKLAMAGHRDGWNFEAVFQHCVNQNETFDAAVEQEARILLDEVGLAAVTRS